MAHINQEQRYVITLMLQQGKLQKEIALFINRSPSVISREIRRNRDAKTGIYESNVAQRAYER
ncbi:Helix-turn-helix domain-containing protein, partial [Williamwhitmania taraxaci]